MYGAGAALGHAASEFGTLEAYEIADHPEQWHLRIHIHLVILSIDV